MNDKTLLRVIECAEILDKRPRPMCRDCADENGICPNSGLDCDMRKLFSDARAALSCASPADKQKAIVAQPVVDGVTIQTFEDWWAMNERYIDPTELMALCESVWNDSRACIAAPVAQSQHSGIAAQQAVAPKGWRERLDEMRDADYTYSQHPELARVVFDSVIDALDELEVAAPSQQEKEVAQPANPSWCNGCSPENCSGCGTDKTGAPVFGAMQLSGEEAALPAPMPVAAFWYDPETSVERRRMTEYADQIVITGCNIRWGNYTTPFYAAPIPQQEPKPVAPDVPADWRKFVEDCAGTAGGMVNGNNLSRLAFRLLSNHPAPQEQPKPDAQALPEAKDAELLQAAGAFAKAHIECDELEEIMEDEGDSAVSDAEYEVKMAAYNKTKTALINAYRAAIDAAIAAKKEKL